MYNAILCRLCLYKSEFLINIFEENGKHGYVAAEVIEDLLRLKVKREDRFPQQVCINCLDKLTDFKVFKNRCFDSHAAFEKEFPIDGNLSAHQYPISSIVCKQDEDRSGETITDDYLPPQPLLGHIDIKIEKEDDDEGVYDGVDTGNVITSDIEIKTECLDEGDSYGVGTADSEIVCKQDEDRSEETITDDYLPPQVDTGNVISSDIEIKTECLDEGDSYELGTADAEDEADVNVHQIWIPEVSSVSSVPHTSKWFSLEQEEGEGSSVSVSMELLDRGGSSAGTRKEMVVEFPCPQCGKKFMQLGCLKKHIMVTHREGTTTTQKNYQCKICKMRFAKAGNLVRHSMVHTEQRSVSCRRKQNESRYKRYRERKKLSLSQDDLIARRAHETERKRIYRQKNKLISMAQPVLQAATEQDLIYKKEV